MIVFCDKQINIIFIEQHPTKKAMCFLKNLNIVQNHSMQLQSKFASPQTDIDIEMICLEENIFDQNIQFFPMPSKNNYEHQIMMLNCLQMLKFNSQLLQCLEHKIQENCERIEHTSALLQEKTLETGIQKQETNNMEPLKNTRQISTNSASEHKDSVWISLFGAKIYSYKLQLTQKFPQLIYKDRNFGLKVKLVKIGEKNCCKNSNIINLCVGLVTKQGEWINATRTGECFLKGRLDSELYHGQTQFVKLAPRDVSRGFPGKVVDLVVYTKPSVLTFSGSSDLEQHVNADEIQPLIIRNIVIMAKRREYKN